MYLVTKLPGAGPVYRARDLDGTMKDITFDGTLFEKELPPDPWYRVEKIDAAGAKAHEAKLSELAAARDAKARREELANEAAQIAVRYENIVCPLKRDADAETDEYRTFVARLTDDAKFREDRLLEIEERAGAEEKRRERSRAVMVGRAEMEERVGDLLSDGHVPMEERRKAAAKVRLDFERGVLLARIKEAEAAGDEEGATRLRRHLDETYPLDTDPTPASTGDGSRPEGELTIDKKKRGKGGGGA